MKSLFLALVAVLLVIVQPAQAGICHRLTHLGIVHKAAKVAGAPFYALGFVLTATGGLVFLPMVTAAEDFQDNGFVPW